MSSVNFEKADDTEHANTYPSLGVTTEQRKQQTEFNRQQVVTVLNSLPHAIYRGVAIDNAIRSPRVTTEITPTSATQRASLQRHLLWGAGGMTSREPLPVVVIGSRQQDKKTELLVSTLIQSDDSQYEYGTGFDAVVCVIRHYTPKTLIPVIRTCMVKTTEWAQYQAMADAREEQLVAAASDDHLTAQSTGNLHIVRNVFHHEATPERLASAQSVTIKGSFSELYPEATNLDDATMLAFNVVGHLDYLSSQLT